MSTAAATAKHLLTKTSSLGPKLTPFSPSQFQVLPATHQSRHQYHHLDLIHSALPTHSFRASFGRSSPSSCRFSSSTAKQHERQWHHPCWRCGSMEHSQIDCSEPVGTKRCFTCNSLDHISSECSLPRKCRRCGSEGHLDGSCPKPKVCFRCGSGSHLASACSKPKSCFLCGSEGHVSRKCPQRGESGLA